MTTLRFGLGLALGLLVGGAASNGEEAPTQRPGARVPPAPADSDLREIRDIFRYADEPAPEAPRRARDFVGAEPVETEDTPAASPSARLVGLVHREGRLVAALAIDGQVVLVGEGESAAGFTVLRVTEEAVRLRDPAGEESSLPLP